MRIIIGVALAALLAVSSVASPAEAQRRGEIVASDGTVVEAPRRAQRSARAGKRSGRRAGRSTFTEQAIVRPRGKRRAGATRVVREARSGRRTASRRGRAIGGVPPAAFAGAGSMSGIASFYWQGHTTASGAPFNPEGMTAAHRTLPFGTRVRVTHAGNGRSVVVTINDRGPFIAGRIIDLSRGAAGVLGMHGQGLANVRVEVLGR